MSAAGLGELLRRLAVFSLPLPPHTTLSAANQAPRDDGQGPRSEPPPLRVGARSLIRRPVPPSSFARHRHTHAAAAATIDLIAAPRRPAIWRLLLLVVCLSAAQINEQQRGASARPSTSQRSPPLLCCCGRAPNSRRRSAISVYDACERACACAANASLHNDVVRFLLLLLEVLELLLRRLEQHRRRRRRRR